MKSGSRDKVACLHRCQVPGRIALQRSGKVVVEFGIRVPPALGLSKVTDLATVSTAVIWSQHPADAQAKTTLLGQQTQESILPVVVDIAEILVFHGRPPAMDVDYGDNPEEEDQVSFESPNINRMVAIQPEQELKFLNASFYIIYRYFAQAAISFILAVITSIPP